MPGKPVIDSIMPSAKRGGRKPVKKHLRKQGGAQSIRRTIKILRYVAMYNERGVRLSKVAVGTELHVTTASRILSVLVEEGFVTHDPNTKLYNLGFEFHSLAKSTEFSRILNTYRTTLENIAQETSDATYLLVRSGYDTLCIDRVESAYSIRIHFDVGRRLPIGVGASGVALLAFQSDSEVGTILSNNELRYARYNMTIEIIRHLVGLARELGYARSEGHFLKGVTGVAAPIFNAKNECIASVTVAATSERMSNGRCDEIGQLLKSEIRLIPPLIRQPQLKKKSL
jgi:DNA-binding IclR family transcriptional regulator